MKMCIRDSPGTALLEQRLDFVRFRRGITDHHNLFTGQRSAEALLHQRFDCLPALQLNFLLPVNFPETAQMPLHQLYDVALVGHKKAVAK